MPRFDNAIVQWVHIKGEILEFEQPDGTGWVERYILISCSCGWFKEENYYVWYDANPGEDLGEFLKTAWIQHLKSVKQ